MPPSLVILEASQKLFRILCKIDTFVLAPILSIEKAESLRNIRFNVFDSLSRLNLENGCQRNKSINIFHLLRSLSRDLSRIKYQLEEFIYWADDVLLASLASSDRGERLVNDDDRARDYKFAALIDTCADVVQAGWMILGQISKANEFTSGSLRLYQAKINQKRVTVTSRAQLLKSTQTRGSIRSKVSKASLSQIHRCLKTRAATLRLYRQKDSLRRSFSRFTKFINPKGVSVSIKVAKSYLKLIK
ncbi:expressed protein [Phakopsora pachyrhizi]|uniref:Expressed protein n=1 Tax=Phakopsora pachyrhizi TaxID=170000 RepID=A0AAV0AVB0_PHAPC|nr:expressed protein [Phakopsora pachyrhizi]